MQNSYKEHKYITSQTLRFHNTPKGKKLCNLCRYSNVLKLYSKYSENNSGEMSNCPEPSTVFDNNNNRNYFVFSNFHQNDALFIF